jgi:hypothetical protein
MAKTNAENQAAYKNRHLKDVSGTSERLDVLINVSAKIALPGKSKSNARDHHCRQASCINRKPQQRPADRFLR